jgi:predicted ATPase
VAAGVDATVEAVEGRCAALARRGQFVQASGTADWPDGTVTARYGFRHTLYREMLYDRVPASQRVRWHRHIGARLEAGYRDQARQIAPELAAHFVRGRDAQRAVQYLQYAGEIALQRSAHQEAHMHITQGLELLQMWPNTPERTHQELALYLILGPLLIATQGQGNPAVQRVYVHARTLCQQVEDLAGLVSTLYGSWLVALAQAKLLEAQEIAAQLFGLTQQHPDTPFLLVAYRVLGTTLFFRGEFLQAQAHLQQGRVLYDARADRPLPWHYGFDIGVACATIRALSLSIQGLLVQAQQHLQEMLTRAHTLAHPPSLTLALNYAAKCSWWCREEQAVHALNEAATRIATTQSFALWVAEGRVIQGWALVAQGQTEQGVTQISEALATMRTLTGGLWQPYHLTVLADLYGRRGQADRGLSLLAEALELTQTTGEYWYAAETHRLTGELLLRQDLLAAAQAEVSFQHALALARRQQAKLWELRAALSLARLWQQQGKRAEASALLAPVYEWFTEGFDTVDLQEAKARLEELGG